MLRKKTVAILLVTVAVLAVAAVVAGVLVSTQQIAVTGQITAVGVGVYQDQACTVNLTSFSWGNIGPGASITHVVYVRNTGNSIEALSVSTSSWSPAVAASVLSLSWDAPSTLQPGQVVAVTFTLAASADTGNLTVFSFCINVTGTG